MFFGIEPALIFAGIALGLLIWRALKIVQPARRGLIYQRGKPVRLVGPGVVYLIPFIERVEHIAIPADVTQWHGQEGEIVLNHQTWQAKTEDTEPILRGEKVIPIQLSGNCITIRKMLQD